VEKRQQPHILRNEEREKWIEDYVERESTVARMRVQDAKTAMMHKHEHLGNVEKGRSTTTKPNITSDEMLNAIGDSLSDLASFKDEEDEDHEDDDEEDTGHGKLSEDDDHGWVMGTISQMVHHRMTSFWQKQMRLDELTQPGWGDVANYFCARGIKYWMTDLKVPAVGKPETDSTAATPSPTIFGELMHALYIVSREAQMPQVMPRQGSCQTMLGSVNHQAVTHIVLPLPAAVPDS